MSRRLFVYHNYYKNHPNKIISIKQNNNVSGVVFSCQASFFLMNGRFITWCKRISCFTIGTEFFLDYFRKRLRDSQTSPEQLNEDCSNAECHCWRLLHQTLGTVCSCLSMVYALLIFPHETSTQCQTNIVYQDGSIKSTSELYLFKIYVYERSSHFILHYLVFSACGDDLNIWHICISLFQSVSYEVLWKTFGVGVTPKRIE